jgi:hypothetical protein
LAIPSSSLSLFLVSTSHTITTHPALHVPQHALISVDHEGTPMAPKTSHTKPKNREVFGTPTHDFTTFLHSYNTLVLCGGPPSHPQRMECPPKVRPTTTLGANYPIDFTWIQILIEALIYPTLVVFDVYMSTSWFVSYTQCVPSSNDFTMLLLMYFANELTSQCFIGMCYYSCLHTWWWSFNRVREDCDIHV